MSSIEGIAGVQARIASIQSRLFGTSQGSGTIGSTEVSGPTGVPADFAPFGDAYQQALSDAGIIPDAATAAAAGITVDQTTGVVSGLDSPLVPGTAGTPGTSGFALGSATGVSAAQRYAQSYGTASSLVASISGDAAALDGPVYTGASSMGLGQYGTQYAGTQYSGGQYGVGVAGVAFTGAATSTPTYTGVPTSYGSSVGQIGGFGAMPVPSELQAYGNGTLPDAELQSIGQSGHRLWGPAATSWRNAVAAARADGVELKVTDSYRTYDQQVELAKDKGLYADGGLAAVPGTSNHGWGMAVDVDVTNPATLSWIRANGYKYGFVEGVTREPWHWEFRPQQA